VYCTGDEEVNLNSKARHLLADYKKGDRDFHKGCFGGVDVWASGILREENGQVSFQSANFRLADFSRAWLDRVDFRFSDFQGADFSDAHLGFVDFRGANLSYALFNGARMDSADLRGANLRGADLRHTNLANIKIDHKTCLSETVLDPKAIPEKIPDEALAREGMQVDGEFVIGWRTDSSLYMQGQSHVTYEEGRIYTAPIFSVCTETTCHPGIYLRGSRNVDLVKVFLGAIRVCCLRRELVGTKGLWSKGHKRQFRAKRVLVLPS
jgi:uncharacterized protein YjbI with pentapeptide repeats